MCLMDIKGPRERPKAKESIKYFLIDVVFVGKIQWSGILQSVMRDQ